MKKRARSSVCGLAHVKGVERRAEKPSGNGPTYWYDDDDQQDDNANDQPHPHLHVLPPHLLSDAVGAPPEALGRSRQIVRLVLQRIQALAALRHLVDVFPHHANGVIDLLTGEKQKTIVSSPFSDKVQFLGNYK